MRLGSRPDLTPQPHDFRQQPARQMKLARGDVARKFDIGGLAPAHAKESQLQTCGKRCLFRWKIHEFPDRKVLVKKHHLRPDPLRRLRQAAPGDAIVVLLQQFGPMPGHRLIMRQDQDFCRRE